MVARKVFDMNKPPGPSKKSGPKPKSSDPTTRKTASKGSPPTDRGKTSVTARVVSKSPKMGASHMSGKKKPAPGKRVG
jgi:hypothetical protein